MLSTKKGYCQRHYLQVYRHGKVMPDGGSVLAVAREAKVLEVVAALLELHRSATILTKRNVPPPLYNKALRLFGTWRGALGEAGLDYDAATNAAFAARADARTSVSPEIVIGQLRSRLSAGHEMHYAAVRRDDGTLAQRCARTFGSHDAALLAAGLSPDEIRRQDLWSPERILSEMRDCLEAGWDMNSCAAQRRASRLFGAACREFGSWDEALLAVGADPALIRRDMDTEANRGDLFDLHCRKLFSVIRPEWQLQRRIAIGKRYYEPDIVLPSRGPERRWGDFKVSSWGNSARRTLEKYTEHVDELLFIYLLGDERPPTGVARFQSVRDFEQEARAAGVGPTFDDIIALETMEVETLACSAMALIWTEEHCVATVRAFPAGCRNVSWARENGRGLNSAVTRYWDGDWDAFLIAAGLDPAVERRQLPPVTREDTIRWLRTCHQEGHEMSATALMKLPRGYTMNVMLSRYFRGLRRACAELGLPYAPRRKPGRPLE